VSRATDAGFTLLELLVTITIVAILAGVVSPMVFRNVGDAKVTAAKSQIEALGLALDTYYLHCGDYPTTSEGLDALMARPETGSCPAWRGPYLKKGVPNDPWGRPYLYLSPGEANSESYDLSTLGKDGKAGGEGEAADVTSWGGETP
jgi:general secretion pathway protein G